MNQDQDKAAEDTWISVHSAAPDEGDVVACKYEGVYDFRIVTFWRDTANRHFGLPDERDGKGSQPATHWREISKAELADYLSERGVNVPAFLKQAHDIIEAAQSPTPSDAKAGRYELRRCRDGYFCGTLSLIYCDGKEVFGPRQLYPGNSVGPDKIEQHAQTILDALNRPKNYNAVLDDAIVKINSALRTENEALLNKAKKLEAELDAIKCRNVIRHIESICGVCGSTKAEAGCPSCLSDELDLMRDEFARIKALNSNSEINALCERAVTKITQNVSVIQQRDEAEEKLKALQSSHNEAVKAVEITGETSDGYHTFNELYEYRKVYNAALFNEWAREGKYGVHKSWKHSDGELAFGGGWFIVVAQLPTGQISNHYKTEDWNLFQIEERPLPDTYDGHTPQIALERLRTLLDAKTKGQL
jgi:hypothetical protein